MRCLCNGVDEGLLCRRGQPVRSCGEAYRARDAGQGEVEADEVTMIDLGGGLESEDASQMVILREELAHEDE